MELFPELRCNTYISSILKSVWKTELDIVLEVDKISKKHNLRYYLICGSLLGAVRHHGFIPWDDDMDICMFRKDYESFIEIAKQELPDYIFIQTSFTDKGRNIEYCQLRNSNTTAIDLEKARAIKHFNPKYNQGIFIDLFPLDNVPLHKSVIRRQRFKTLYYQHLYSSKFPEKNTFMKKIEHFFLSPIFDIYGPKKFYKSRTKVFSSIKESGNVGITCFLIGDERFVWKKSWFDETTYVSFENHLLPIPKEYNLILNKNYGNWNLIKKGTQLHSGIFFNPYVSFNKREKNLDLSICNDVIEEKVDEFEFRLLLDNETFYYYATPYIMKVLNCSDQESFRNKVRNLKSLSEENKTMGNNPQSFYWILYKKQIVGIFKVNWFINASNFYLPKISYKIQENISLVLCNEIVSLFIAFLGRCGISHFVICSFD